MQQLIFSWRSVQERTCGGPALLALGRRAEPRERRVEVRAGGR